MTAVKPDLKLPSRKQRNIGPKSKTFASVVEFEVEPIRTISEGIQLVRVRPPAMSLKASSASGSHPLTSAQFSFYSSLAYAYYPEYISGTVGGLTYDREAFILRLRDELQAEIRASNARTPSEKLKVISQSIRKDICILDVFTLEPLILPLSWSGKSPTKECIVLLSNGPFTELAGSNTGSSGAAPRLLTTLFQPDHLLIRQLSSA
jgi:hypothetical protein